MNESSSYFVYALSDQQDAFIKNVEGKIDLKWTFQKGMLDFDAFPVEAYLFVAEMNPGNNSLRFVSSTKVNTQEMKKAYSTSKELRNMFQQLTESSQPLPTNDSEVASLIDRTDNVFANVDMWMQPGAVPPSHFNCVKIPNFFGQGWTLRQYMEKMFETGDLPDYIPPRKGTASPAVVIPGGSVGIDRNTSVGYIPLGEALEEELEVVERGNFWIPLWVFLYEENAGSSLLVDLDPDDSEYHTTFELPSGLQLSVDETKDVEKGRIHIVRGHNLHIFAELLDRLSQLGNPGHTYSYTINKNTSQGKPAFKGQFDGDGSDYIYRISLKQVKK